MLVKTLLNMICRKLAPHLSLQASVKICLLCTVIGIKEEALS